jgi:acetoacetyl-CoA synthetase
VAEGYDYVYAHIKRDVMLASMSGGTDIMGTFVSGCPLLPVWRGEIQCATLGMQVDVFDDEGRQLRGAKGELVCTAPFPSMPVGFWNDPGDAKYHAAYFEKYPNVWCHGDYVEITEHGGMIIYGRSDAVLNPGGVRIGTAEIYRQVEQLDEVVESLVIGQDWPLQNPTDVRVVLFVRLRDGLTARRRADRAHQAAYPSQHDAAPRAGKGRAGRGYPAHQERQNRRTRRAACRASPAG